MKTYADQLQQGYEEQLARANRIAKLLEEAGVKLNDYEPGSELVLRIDEELG